MQIREVAQLLSATEIDQTLARLAREIVEQNGDTNQLALIGIRRRGVPLAERLAKHIRKQKKTTVSPDGRLDVLLDTLEVTLYRDNLTTIAAQPVVKTPKLTIDINDKNIVLVDDVLYTGSTIRAAVNTLFECGRPNRIQLCVLIDRGWRTVPIAADYVGRSVQTTANQIVEVRLQEIDAEERVLLVEKTADAHAEDLTVKNPT